MTTNDGTNESKATSDDLDAMDLMESFKLTSVHPRRVTGGVWVNGTTDGYRFEALVFPEHATQPDYELDDSRISKLSVRRISDRVTVASFDRGWDIRPTTPVVQQVVDLLATGLAENVYAS